MSNMTDPKRATPIRPADARGATVCDRGRRGFGRIHTARLPEFRSFARQSRIVDRISRFALLADCGGIYRCLHDDRGVLAAGRDGSDLTGGFLFATFPGALFNVTAATAGATLIFLAARWGMGERLGRKLEESQGVVRKIKDGIDENQWSMLFLIRLVPAVPFFVANLVPAFLEVPLRRFVVSTFLGIIPGAIVYTSVGAGLGEVFARGEVPNLGIIFEPHILLPILGLCALAALPIVLKALRGGKSF